MLVSSRGNNILTTISFSQVFASIPLQWILEFICSTLYSECKNTDYSQERKWELRFREVWVNTWIITLGSSHLDGTGKILGSFEEWASKKAQDTLSYGTKQRPCLQEAKSMLCWILTKRNRSLLFSIVCISLFPQINGTLQSHKCLGHLWLMWTKFKALSYLRYSVNDKSLLMSYAMCAVRQRH